MLGLPSGSDGEESACNAGDVGLTPGSGRSPGERNGNPLQYSCLEKPMDRGAWWAIVHRVAKSRTQLKRLNNGACTWLLGRHFSFVHLTSECLLRTRRWVLIVDLTVNKAGEVSALDLIFSWRKKSIINNACMTKMSLGINQMRKD